MAREKGEVKGPFFFESNETRPERYYPPAMLPKDVAVKLFPNSSKPLPRLLFPDFGVIIISSAGIPSLRGKGKKGKKIEYISHLTYLLPAKRIN